MKRKMPKKVLLALVAALVVAIGSAVAVFASESVTGLGWWQGAASTAQEVSGEGSWYYTIDVTSLDEYEEAYFNVEMYDTNWYYYTTGVRGDAWGAAELSTCSIDSYATLAEGSSYVVQIVRDESLITVTYYEIIKNAAVLRYTFAMDGTVFLNTVCWHVLAQQGTIDVEFYEGTADLGTVMTTANEITKIEVISLSQDTFVFMGRLNLEGTEIAVTYDNGITVNVTLGDAGEINYTRDPFELHFIYYMIDDDGWDCYADDVLYYTGEYTLCFYAYNYDWDLVLSENDGMTDQIITVRDVTAEDAEDATEMELDGTYTVTEDDQWFSFTPTEDGYYVFRTTEDSSTYNSLVDLYVEYEGKLIEWYMEYCGDGSLVLRAYLEAGQTYYFRTISYYGSVSVYGEYDVTIVEGKTITALEITTLGNSEFTQYVDRLYIGGTVVTLTYEDGTTETVTFGDSAYYAIDSYGNYIWFCALTEEGEDDLYEGDYVYLDPGTYTLVVYHGDVEDATQIITVVSIEDSDTVTTIELLDTEYSTDMTNGGSTSFVFTPSEDGQYYFVYSGDDSYYYEDEWIYLPYCFKVYTYDDGMESYSYTSINYADYAYDENGYIISIYDEAYDGWYDAYELTGGTTYIIVLYYCGYTEDWEFDSEATATVSMMACQISHTHTYDDGNITWTWSDDYSTATAELRCDSCSETLTGTATVTSVTTEATETEDGSIVYTAVVTLNGVEYTITKTVVIPATGSTGTESGTETETDSETETTTDTSSTATSTSTDADSTDNSVPVTGDVSTWGYYVLLIGAAAAAFVLAKKKVNA